MGERIEKFKSTMKVAEIKSHFQRNQKAYVTGGVCLAIGVLGTLVVTKGDTITVTQNLGDGNKAVVGNAEHVTMVIAELERRGHPGNIVRCIETGEVFASQNRAAELLGISASNLGKHLQGHQESVNGLTFENLGEAR